MNPRSKIRSSPGQDPGLSRQVQGGLIVAALVILPVIAITGSDSFRAALDFASGVLSLVSLSASVAWGLLATDRLLLNTRQRLLAQGIHRGTATASLGFLLLHAAVKVSLGHVSLIGALVPFGLGVTGTSALIGFGSLAGLLMVVAASTGAARSALAGNVQLAARWRALHMLAYPAWCFALVHGLYAGRPAAAWVTAMYCLALAGVVGIVALRLLPRQTQRQVAERIVALMGGDRPAAEAPEAALRDLSTSPLPGTAGSGPGAEFEREFPRRRPEGLDDALGRPAAQPLGSPLTAALGQPLAPPRGDAPRIPAPSPALYEATPSGSLSADAGMASAESFLGGIPAARGPLPSEGPGTGISAAYRAVSLAADGPARTTGTAASGPSGDVPFAERVPMTEELPIVNESGPRPESWPTPSPAPPGQAFAPPAPATRYETADAAPYDTGSIPAYDTGTGSIPAYGTGSGTGSVPTYDTGGIPTYDTGSMPTYNTGSTPAYETGGIPAYGSGSGGAATYDTGGIPAYETGATPQYTDPYGAASAYGSGSGIGGGGYADPSAPRTSLDDTQQAPGPLYPPTAGEPWNTPAGERP
ncbi:hypothetical protein [Streptomyces sp. NPDC127084]|uniref:hypothetical protein n=1 Tax=Streptomyces sp. NPDC127084 TaxID=3347133 RepID=UPI00364D52A6